MLLPPPPDEPERDGAEYPVVDLEDERDGAEYPDDGAAPLDEDAEERGDVAGLRCEVSMPLDHGLMLRGCDAVLRGDDVVSRRVDTEGRACGAWLRETPCDQPRSRSADELQPRSAAPPRGTDATVPLAVRRPESGAVLRVLDVRVRSEVRHPSSRPAPRGAAEAARFPEGDADRLPDRLEDPSRVRVDPDAYEPPRFRPASRPFP